CRDRNRLALQGDLLGAVALGIRNVLVLGGDDPKAGDQPEAKAVYDLDSRGLLAMAHAMRSSSALPTGTKIDGGVRVVLGAADVPLDPPAGWEPKSLQSKIAAGADFVQTQFCIEVLRELAEIPGVAGAHVMAPMNFAEIPGVIVESGVAGRKLAHAVH